MPTTYRTETVETSSWNLPESTSNTISVTNSSSRKGDDRIRNVTETTTTVKTSTSESLASTAYNYKTTGATYSSKIVGEEIVNVNESAQKLIAMPYMKTGELVKVIGEDFEPNTEIRLYLDEIVLTPAVNSDEMTNNYSRPWTWTWCFDYTNNKWKFYSSDNSYVCYYDDVSDSWNTSIDMSWADRITRTPWIVNRIKNLSLDESEKTKWLLANSIDVALNKEYKSGYSETKSVVVTDDNGYFEAYIAIPEKTTTGKHNITAETVLPSSDKFYGCAATTIEGVSYSGVVQKRLVEVVTESVYRDVEAIETWQKYATVETTVTKRNKTITDYGYYDPVAQTFRVSTDQFLVGIDVYFSGAVPTQNNKKPWIALREVIDGVPAETMIYAADIDKSTIQNADNLVETVVNGKVIKMRRPTYIPFDYPLFVSKDKTYAITLGCNEDGYELYYSQIGKKDVTDGTAIIYQKQQSESGVMMKSSNNSVWTPVQEADLTYSLYKAVYKTGRENGKEIYINNIDTGIDFFSTLNVSIAKTIFENTGIDCYYAITTGEDNNSSIDFLKTCDWKALTLDKMVSFATNDEYIKNGMNLKLKFVLWTDNADVTPSMNLDTMEIFVGKFKDKGSYIQNIVEL